MTRQESDQRKAEKKAEKNRKAREKKKEASRTSSPASPPPSGRVTRRGSRPPSPLDSAAPDVRPPKRSATRRDSVMSTHSNSSITARSRQSTESAPRTRRGSRPPSPLDSADPDIHPPKRSTLSARSVRSRRDSGASDRASDSDSVAPLSRRSSRLLSISVNGSPERAGSFFRGAVERQSRRERHAESKRKYRANMSPDKRQEITAKNTEAHRESRANMSPDKRQEITAKNTEAHRESRANMSPDKRQEITAKNTEAHRESRANMSPDKRQEIAETDAEAHRDRRRDQSQATADRFRVQDAAQHRKSRLDLSPKTAAEKRKHHAEKERQRYHSLSDIQAEERRIKRNERQRERRRAQSEDEKALERERSRERYAERIRRMTAVQLAEFRAKSAAASKKTRDNMTPQQRVQHNLMQAASKKIQRNTVRNNRISKNHQDYSRFMRDGIAKSDDFPVVYDESVYPEGPVLLRNVLCKACNAKHFPNEPHDNNGTYYECCNFGKLKLDDPPEDFPAFVKTELQTKNGEVLKNARHYNNAFAMVSVGTNIAVPPGRGPYVFRIQGKLFHNSPKFLKPQDRLASKHAQIYILDSNDAMAATTNAQPKLRNQKFMRRFFEFLKQKHQYVKSLLTTYELIEKQRADLLKLGQKPPDVSLIIDDKLQPHIHPGRQNAPTTSDQVFAFIANDTNGQIPPKTDFRMYARETQHQQQVEHQFPMNCTSPHILPMTYPLLNPFGMPGWSTDYVPEPYPGYQQLVRPISLRQYCCALLSDREGEFNPYINGGCLTQQVIVDMGTQLEQSRISYILTHQDKLRRDDYLGVHKALQKKAKDLNAEVGGVVILPSTFVGGPRYMQQHCLDSMALFAQKGNPDLFITMTCNPRWPEITENLEPHQTASDRPDIVCKVFKRKLEGLISELYQNECFGKAIASVHVIEYQKRSLPHAHIVVTLEEGFTSPEDIDRYISAEIPDKKLCPRLYEIVTRTMIHGPCRPGLCKDGDKCKKGFPKPYAEKTSLSKDGYATYRRRPSGDKKFDNRMVVPYCPYLSLKFDCHINVEVVTGMKCVKYVFKYMHKGYDISNFIALVDGKFNYNEPNCFMSGRFLSAPEAFWRIMGAPIHYSSHTIVRLPIHLDDGRISELTEFFKMNLQHGGTLRYNEFPRYFRFVDSAWIPRKQKTPADVIARIHSPRTNNLEIIALRVLLTHARGPTGFENLRTLNGKQYATFLEAAQAQGLMRDDSVLFAIFDELAALQMPETLRECFVNMIVNQIIPNTKALAIWNRFKDEFIIDLQKKLPNRTDYEYHNMALHLIDRLLREQGKKIENYDLPTPDPKCLPPDMSKQKKPAITPNITLNAAQQDGLDAILQADVDIKRKGAKADRLFFVNGPGGSGKTTLYEHIIAEFKSRGKKVYVMATTGIAATLLDDGQTVHRGFRLPVPLEAGSKSYMRQDSAEAQAIREASVILIDEITMLHKYGLDIIDDVLREFEDINSNFKDQPFGSKIVVVGGDFRQLLPVIPNGGPFEAIENCVIQSRHWREFKRIALTQNMRSAGNSAEYTKWLLQLGTGERLNDENSLESNAVEIPEDMLLEVQPHENSMSVMIDTIFGKTIHTLSHSDLSQRAILASTVAETIKINNMIHNRMTQATGKSNERIYLSSDEADTDNVADKQNFPIEYINKLTPSGLPPHELKLCVGSIVLLLRNLNPKEGLCNGTRLIVTHLLPNAVVGKIVANPRFDGNVVFIPKMELSANDNTTPFKINRFQIPVIPAFAMTINKSQGQTLENVGIYLNEVLFSHGQLYVALSRCRQREKIKIFIQQQGSRQGMLMKDDRVYTRNIVYRQVFQHGELKDSKGLGQMLPPLPKPVPAAKPAAPAPLPKPVSAVKTATTAQQQKSVPASQNAADDDMEKVIAEVEEYMANMTLPDKFGNYHVNPNDDACEDNTAAPNDIELPEPNDGIYAYDVDEEIGDFVAVNMEDVVFDNDYNDIAHVCPPSDDEEIGRDPDDDESPLSADDRMEIADEQFPANSFCVFSNSTKAFINTDQGQQELTLHQLCGYNSFIHGMLYLMTVQDRGISGVLENNSFFALISKVVNEPHRRDSHWMQFIFDSYNSLMQNNNQPQFRLIDDGLIRDPNMSTFLPSISDVLSVCQQQSERAVCGQNGCVENVKKIKQLIISLTRQDMNIDVRIGEEREISGVEEKIEQSLRSLPRWSCRHHGSLFDDILFLELAVINTNPGVRLNNPHHVDQYFSWNCTDLNRIQKTVNVDGQQYRLRFVVERTGHGGFGHFKTYVVDAQMEGRFLLLDDAPTPSITSTIARRTTPVLLAYSRVRQEADDIDVLSQALSRL